MELFQDLRPSVVEMKISRWLRLNSEVLNLSAQENKRPHPTDCEKDYLGSFQYTQQDPEITADD